MRSKLYAKAYMKGSSAKNLSVNSLFKIICYAQYKN
jgi:hypothetical protein